MKKLINNNCLNCKRICLKNFFNKYQCLSKNFQFSAILKNNHSVNFTTISREKYCYCCDIAMKIDAVCHYQHEFFDCSLCRDSCRLRGFNYINCNLINFNKAICSCCLFDPKLFANKNIISIINTTILTTQATKIYSNEPEEFTQKPLNNKYYFNLFSFSLRLTRNQLDT